MSKSFKFNKRELQLVIDAMEIVDPDSRIDQETKRYILEKLRSETKPVVWESLDNGNQRVRIDGLLCIVGPIRDALSFQGVIKDGAGKVLCKFQTDHVMELQTILVDYARKLAL